MDVLLPDTVLEAETNFFFHCFADTSFTVGLLLFFYSVITVSSTFMTSVTYNVALQIKITGEWERGV